MQMNALQSFKKIIWSAQITLGLRDRAVLLTSSLSLKTNISCTVYLLIFVFFGPNISPTLIAQSNLPTVPTAIYVGNAAFQAPILGAKVALVLLETFENKKRPVQTFIGEFVSDSLGAITVSLIPDKSYMVTTSKSGYFTQLSKIKTTNFSRTRQNKKGISLRPRNIIAIKGNIVKPQDLGRRACVYRSVVICVNVRTDLE